MNSQPDDQSSEHGEFDRFCAECGQYYDLRDVHAVTFHRYYHHRTWAERDQRNDHRQTSPEPGSGSPEKYPNVLHHCFRPDEPAEQVPAGTWFRECGAMPLEPRPRMDDLEHPSVLGPGLRVYMECAHEGYNVSGWGRITKVPLGWAVEFANGSMVGMPVPDLMRHCWIPKSQAASASQESA